MDFLPFKLCFKEQGLDRLDRFSPSYVGVVFLNGLLDIENRAFT